VEIFYPMIYFYPTGHAGHFEPYHPERPERVEALVQRLQAAGYWDPYPQVQPLELPVKVLHKVHTPAYLERLQRVCASGAYYDMDTYTRPASWQLALAAAGGAAQVARAVWDGEARRGFALCRPPGHHATPEQAMGFCLLNNIALAAEYLLQARGAERLAIVDLDLHHGNGTQEIFYRRGEVFYLSTHQSPFYPGSGQLEETGAGAGAGATANFPLLPFAGDTAFRTILEELILPLLERFGPQMILVSFGFDIHWLDPLGNLRVSAGGTGELIARLADWADQHCQGRLALVLEGGYDLEAGGACSQAAVAALLGKAFTDPLGPSPQPESDSWRGMAARARAMWSL
jgi:acetoin utilization deacetylase AcuC-like enzyme